MKTIFFFLISFIFFAVDGVYGQEHLPNISVISHNGKVVVSWQNNYKKTISNILIQRSYDSLKNFSTIGTVLNPLNKENGYLDANPPYKRMYYRVSVSFEGGTYEIGKSERPIIDEEEELEPFDVTSVPKEEIIKTDSVFSDSEKNQVSKADTPEIKKIIVIENQNKILTPEIKDSITSQTKPINEQVDSSLNLSLQKNSALFSPIYLKRNYDFKIEPLKKTKPIIITLESKIQPIQWEFPSSRVFTNNQNTITIQLRKTTTRKYSLKVYDESENLVLYIKKINEDFFYLDKSNFRKTGWYHFEIMNDGDLVEKNKFLISKDKTQK